MPLLIVAENGRTVWALPTKNFHFDELIDRLDLNRIVLDVFVTAVPFEHPPRAAQIPGRTQSRHVGLLRVLNDRRFKGCSLEQRIA